MKKIIVLIISILIPLIAATAICLYGANYRYLPSNNSEILAEFYTDFNKGAITSEERIELYRQMENYYYEKDPILKKDILDENGDRILTLAIYRNLCIYQPSGEVDETLKTLFEVFVYNVNYDIIKSYFKLDNMNIVEEADMPVFTVTFIPTNGKDEFSIELKNRSNVVIPDFASTPEYADSEGTTKNYVQSNIFREYESTNTLSKFSDDANIKITATLTIENDDDTTTTIDATRDIANEYIADFKHKGEEIDETNLEVGYREASVDDTYKKAGYFKWLFGHYLWWEALIAFALTGIITGTFYLVFTAEDANKKNIKKKRR